MSICENNWLKRLFHFLVPLQHPYTIASLPTDETVKLIVRNGRFPLISNKRYLVTGAFEPRLAFMQKPGKPGSPVSHSVRGNTFLSSGALSLSRLSFEISARRVLMCVGGSAISFALPLLRILNFNGVTVKLMWVVRDFRDLKVLHHSKITSMGWRSILAVHSRANRIFKSIISIVMGTSIVQHLFIHQLYATLAEELLLL